MSQDKIGTDEWVEKYKGRVGRETGVRGLLTRISGSLPVWGWLVVLVVVGFLLPLATSNSFVIRVAGNVALLGTLALGLNVVVGYTGLLDLGFIAFYGIGAYAYAYLSSDFTGIHLPTIATLIIITLISTLFGFLLGLASLRLLGDYLAIVTLGFGLIFFNLMTGLTRVSLPGLAKPIDLTGGPNGIVNLDPLSFFGFTANSVTDYYLILLIVLALIMLVIYHLQKSRVGRAWEALREDELAAEAMGLPTRRLKIQAFAAGAAIAGLSGGIFASWQGSVFPGNFDTTLLITVYAIIVLGGLGSLPGVLLGAAIIVAVPDVLRNADLAGKLFYAGTIIMLAATLKPRWQTPLLLIAVFVFGLVLRPVLMALSPVAFVEAGTPLNDMTRGWLMLYAAGILLAMVIPKSRWQLPALIIIMIIFSFIIHPFLLSLAPETFAGLQSSGAALTNAIQGWLAIPKQATRVGNFAFGALIVLVLWVSRIKNTVTRAVVLVPTLYLLVFVWETRLSQEDSVTRLLFVGVLLIVLMIYRPNGLLGARRVEIV